MTRSSGSFAIAERHTEVKPTTLGTVQCPSHDVMVRAPLPVGTIGVTSPTSTVSWRAGGAGGDDVEVNGYRTTIVPAARALARHLGETVHVAALWRDSVM